jgi:hypothetical protein
MTEINTTLLVLECEWMQLWVWIVRSETTEHHHQYKVKDHQNHASYVCASSTLMPFLWVKHFFPFSFHGISDTATVVYLLVYQLIQACIDRNKFINSTSWLNSTVNWWYWTLPIFIFNFFIAWTCQNYIHQKKYN